MPDVLCSMQHAIAMAPSAIPIARVAHVAALATAIVLSAKIVLSIRQIVRLTSHIIFFRLSLALTGAN